MYTTEFPVAVKYRIIFSMSNFTHTHNIIGLHHWFTIDHSCQQIPEVSVSSACINLLQGQPETSLRLVFNLTAGGEVEADNPSKLITSRMQAIFVTVGFRNFFIG